MYLPQSAELGIAELSDFSGLASRGEDLSEFFDILALNGLPAEEALIRKIPAHRARVVAKARMIGTPIQRESRVKPVGFQIATFALHTHFLELWDPTVPHRRRGVQRFGRRGRPAD